MKRIALLFLLTLLAVPVSAQDRTSAVGRVLSSEGETEIVSPDGQVSKAIRSKFILEGDTLATGADGFLQVHFSDGAVIVLSCNSALRIDHYQTGAAGMVELQLLRGRMRTITGTTAPGNYLLKTDMASVRITAPDNNFELFAEPQTRLSSAVFGGGIEIQNSAGSLSLGAEEDFNFSILENDELAVGVKDLPGSLRADLTCS